MIPLLLALIAAPTPLQAWKEEIVCWHGSCGPRAVNLGQWDPIPADYKPMTRYEATP